MQTSSEALKVIALSGSLRKINQNMFTKGCLIPHPSKQNDHRYYQLSLTYYNKRSFVGLIGLDSIMSGFILGSVSSPSISGMISSFRYSFVYPLPYVVLSVSDCLKIALKIVNTPSVSKIKTRSLDRHRLVS